MEPLTQTEKEILKALASGKKHKEIAECMKLNMEQIKYHCKIIFRKLELSNREEAARFYSENLENDSAGYH